MLFELVPKPQLVPATYAASPAGKFSTESITNIKAIISSRMEPTVMTCRHYRVMLNQPISIRYWRSSLTIAFHAAFQSILVSITLGLSKSFSDMNGSQLLAENEIQLNIYKNRFSIFIDIDNTFIFCETFEFVYEIRKGRFEKRASASISSPILD